MKRSLGNSHACREQHALSTSPFIVCTYDTELITSAPHTPGFAKFVSGIPQKEDMHPRNGVCLPPAAILTGRHTPSILLCKERGSSTSILTFVLSLCQAIQVDFDESSMKPRWSIPRKLCILHFVPGGGPGGLNVVIVGTNGNGRSKVSGR
jgi:hypothetical protein